MKSRYDFQKKGDSEMKKLIVVTVVLASVANASADQMSDMATKIEQLEKRIRVLEDECGIEREKTPEEIAQIASAKAKKVAAENAVDEKVDLFLKEYLGVQIGQDASVFTNKTGRNGGGCVLPVLKKYDYFDNAVGVVTEGKLTGVFFYSDFDPKFSRDSVVKQVDESLVKLLASFGVQDSRPKNAPPLMRGRLSIRHSTQRYSIHSREGDGRGWHAPKGSPIKCGIEICNYKLMFELRDKKSKNLDAAGEKLPAL